MNIPPRNLAVQRRFSRQAWKLPSTIEEAMCISQVLYEAIQKIESDLASPAMATDPRRNDIVALLSQMEVVQEQLDSEPTEIDDGD